MSIGEKRGLMCWQICGSSNSSRQLESEKSGLDLRLTAQEVVSGLDGVPWRGKWADMGLHTRTVVCELRYKLVEA